MIRTMYIKPKTLLAYTGVSSALFLVGCAATQTALEHRTLSATSVIKPAVFIEPVSAQQKTIFITVKNTTTEKMSMEQPLADAFKAKGYRVVSNPSQAHYKLHAVVIKVGKMSTAASKTALGGGFGSTLAGAGTGALIGSLGNNTTTLAGGIIGGVAGLTADSLVANVDYTMITDVQISERIGKGAVREQFRASLDNGSSSNTYQTLSQTSDYKQYRTRVVTKANKVNLSFETARPVLVEGLVTKLSGLF